MNRTITATMLSGQTIVLLDNICNCLPYFLYLESLNKLASLSPVTNTVPSLIIYSMFFLFYSFSLPHHTLVFFFYHSIFFASVHPSNSSCFQTKNMAVFEGGKTSDDTINNKRVSDDKVVASNVPPRYYLAHMFVTKRFGPYLL